MRLPDWLEVKPIAVNEFYVMDKIRQYNLPLEIMRWSFERLQI